MLKNRSANYSAISGLEKSDKILMNMSAYVSDRGAVSFSQSIPDKDIYEANKSIADADYEAFKQEIIESIE